MAKTFRTVQGAAFVATRKALAKALPGWRVPLVEPTERMGRSAFTSRPMWISATLDPDPAAAPPPVPKSLPFEYVGLPAVENWEQRYLALDLALARESVPNLKLWDAGEVALFDATIKERGLMIEPLFGGLCREGEPPRFLWIVPPRMVDRLAALGPKDFATELAEWNARSPSPNRAADLHELVKLASLAKTSAREMFIWQVHPNLRSPHPPE